MSAKPIQLAALAQDDRSWSIAEVERETGLGKDTLRVWERRYGFPTPLRDAHGERLYPEAQLNRLRLIKRLLDADQRAGKVVPLSEVQLQARLDTLSAPPLGTGVLPAGVQGAVSLVGLAGEEPDWIGWLALDKTQLIRQSLQQQILRNGLGRVVDEVVAPLCRLVGLAWMRGEISVYQEHLFTETLQALLREAIAAVDAANHGLRQGPRVLLTTTPNELHGLGLLMAECHFALESCERFVLGTSTPVTDIVEAANKLEIDVLALSFSAYAAKKDILENLQQLLAQLPRRLEIWVGGAAALANQRFLPEGVALLTHPSQVCAKVQAWRLQRA